MVKCKRCKKDLKDPKSRELGIGKACLKKHKAEERTKAVQDIHKKMLKTTDPKQVILIKRVDGVVKANIPQTIKRFSCGFEVGYMGFGPSELALNILHYLFPPVAGEEVDIFGKNPPVSMKVSLSVQRFKEEFIATMDSDGGAISTNSIIKWFKKTNQ